jgi:hypothetical protein
LAEGQADDESDALVKRDRVVTLLMRWTDTNTVTWLVGATLLIFLVGCDDKKTEEGDPGDEAETDSGDGDGDGITCPDPFPEFDKSCTAVEDCFVALHQVSCCGTLVAIGLNVADQPTFNEVEMVCVSEYPECECAPGPIVTDDGSETEDFTMITVECVQNSCTTTVP